MVGGGLRAPVCRGWKIYKGVTQRSPSPYTVCDRLMMHGRKWDDSERDILLVEDTPFENETSQQRVLWFNTIYLRTEHERDDREMLFQLYVRT